MRRLDDFLITLLSFESFTFWESCGWSSNPPASRPVIHTANQPVIQPSGQPASQPDNHQSSHPDSQPATYPTIRPASQSVRHPSVQTSSHPSSHQAIQPSIQPASHPFGNLPSLVSLAVLSCTIKFCASGSINSLEKRYEMQFCYEPNECNYIVESICMHNGSTRLSC